MSPTEFLLTRKHLERALDELAARDRHLATALGKVGYPEERRQDAPDYRQFLRIIAGQQLSVKAAATIFARLEDALGPEQTPDRLVALSDERLRAIGFSRQKIGYARGLSQAVLDGRFDIEELADLPDEQVIERITALKGFGRWSAEMFLLFSLGRPDVWPADDLGIQAGVQGIKNLPNRPDRKRTEAIGKRWSPYRGAAAIFAWHYYAKAPM